jgi:hypothetical protein
MKQVASALSQLEATARAPLGDQLAGRIDADVVLTKMRRAIEALAATARKLREPSKATIEDAREIWASAPGNLERLSGRHIRALCSDPDVATSREFVDALTASREFSEKRRWIEGLIASYFALWRPASAGQLEPLLRRAVRGFQGKSPRIQHCRPVADEIFSAKAANLLGARIVKQRARWEVVLAEWGIDRAGRLGQAVANASVDEWTNWFGATRAAWGNNALAQLKFLFDVVLAPDSVSHSQLSKAISEVVLWREIEKSEQLVDAVRKFVLSHPRLGDPRHKPANWSQCAPEAHRKIKAWFSRFDLDFFFKFVIRDDPHQRKKFWLDYIDKVEGDSNVALCADDEWRVRAHTREPLRYSRAIGGGNVSAFIMRFPGSSIVLVEFSQTGNALYCHSGKKFAEKVRGGISQPTLHIRDELKNQLTMQWKVVHRDGWQQDVRGRLARERIWP